MGELEKQGGELAPEEAKNAHQEREEKTSKNQPEKKTLETSQEENLEKKSDEEKTSKKSEEDKNPEIQRRDAQISHYRDKLEKAESEIDKYKSSGVPMPTDPMQVVKLAKSLEGYSEDEIEFVTRNASEKSPSGIIEATKDEWVQDAIEKRREKVAQEKKVPESSSPSASKSGETSAEEAAKDNKEWFKFLKSQEEKNSEL